VVDRAGRRTIYAGGKAPYIDVLFDRAAGHVVAPAWDSSLHLWDEASGRYLETLRGNGGAQGARLSPDGALLVAVGGTSPTVWSHATRAKLGDLEGHTDEVFDARFLDDRLLISLAFNGTALVWDLETRRPLASFQGVEELLVTPDRRHVALLSRGGVRLWSPPATRR